MRYGFTSHHYDAEGKPDGGVTFGQGFTISWQRGALRNEDGTFRHPNGAFIEDIIDAAKDRLEYHQQSPYACDENAQAIALLTEALATLENRTKRRELSGKLGYHDPEIYPKDKL